MADRVRRLELRTHNLSLGQTGEAASHSGAGAFPAAQEAVAPYQYEGYSYAYEDAIGEEDAQIRGEEQEFSEWLAEQGRAAPAPPLAACGLALAVPVLEEFFATRDQGTPGQDGGEARRPPLPRRRRLALEIFSSEEEEEEDSADVFTSAILNDPSNEWRELPAPWARWFSKKANSVFYENRTTGERTWSHPSPPLAAEEKVIEEIN